MGPARAHLATVAIALTLFAVNAQRNPIKDALLLHNDTLVNATFEDCVWRREREPCPDPDLKLNLYTEAEPVKKTVDLYSEDWLRQSGWEPSHETILLVHGYAGGDDTLPIVVLRDAYLRRGGYNVFMLDWGALTQPPCYVAAVHNLRPIAKCAAEALAILRRAGLRPDRLTCVGHSLGAHLCGIIANYLTFRLNRIIGGRADAGLDCGGTTILLGDPLEVIRGIVKAQLTGKKPGGSPCLEPMDGGISLAKAPECDVIVDGIACVMSVCKRTLEERLDPARPLIRSAPALRLDPGDARAVHVLHTNAGRYGEASRLGHADFCLNGGRSQPFCEDTLNEALCSHIWSICYQAESLFRARTAAPCGRRCSVRVPPSRASALPVLMGQTTPMTASGAYCVEEFTAPFCPSPSHPEGDPRCCLDSMYAAAAAANSTQPPRNRPRPLVRLRQRRRNNYEIGALDD